MKEENIKECKINYHLWGTYLCYVSIHLFVSVCLSVCLSIYLSVCLSIYLSVCLSVYLYLPFYLSVYVYISNRFSDGRKV